MDSQKMGGREPLSLAYESNLSRAQKSSCHTVVNKESFLEPGHDLRHESDQNSLSLRPVIKMGRQPRSGDLSLAIGPFDPETDRR
jgi:hypothetical protein